MTSRTVSDRLFRSRARLLTSIAFSAAVLAVSFCVILGPSFTEAHWDWAFGTVGLILGYWLR